MPTETKSSSKTKTHYISIAFCGCNTNSENATNGAQFQDMKYGEGMRVHNSCDKGLRCTVCSKTR